MINYIWFFIFIGGIVFGMVTGNGEILSKGIINSSGASVEFIIKLVGSMCLWCGVMKVAEKSGLTGKIAKVLTPILRVLFKKSRNNEKALEGIVVNITSNMMGLSNAATPYGIKAMEEMQKDNMDKNTANNDMALFLVLNSTCIQIVPTTVISIRAALNSSSPGDIIIPGIITTGTAAIFGVVFCKILEKYF